MDHRLAVFAVQVRQSYQRLRAVELEDEGQVFVQSLFGDALAFRAEGDALPVLPLVLAKVQDLEWLAALDAEQALTRGVDGEAAQVAADPAAAELLGDGEGCAGAAEEVSDEVTFV